MGCGSICFMGYLYACLEGFVHGQSRRLLHLYQYSAILLAVDK